MLLLIRIFFCLIVFFIFLSFKDGFTLSFQSLNITAQKFSSYNDFKVLVAEGDVVVKSEQFLVWAKKAVYETNTRYLTLYNFKAFDFLKNATLEGNKGFWDLKNDEFWGNEIFFFIKKEGIRIKAFEFKKNALNEYFAKKAFITTCEFDCENERDFPPWSLEVENFILTPEGISTGDSTKFKVKKQTLLYFPKTAYLPKISVPITPPRKTGFLFPRFAQGNRLGIGIQIPFFFPYTDQIDFTISPMYFTKRGPMLDFETQFKPLDSLEGILKIRYLKDREKTEFQPEKENPKKDKWWVVGKIDYAPKENLDFHLDIDMVSRKDFLEEFNVGENGFSNVNSLFLERFKRGIEDKTQDYRTSKFWAQGYKSSIYAKIEQSYLDYHGPLKKDTILQPILSFKLNFLPFKISNLTNDLLTHFSFFYTYNIRNLGYYGHKFNSIIELSYPFRVHYFYNQLKFSYFSDYYKLQKNDGFEDSNIFRSFYDVSFSSYTQLFKAYEIYNFKLLHILKPYIVYYLRGRSSEKEIPVFDYQDTLKEKLNYVEYGLWQTFSLPGKTNFLRIKAYQQYKFNSEKTAITLSSEQRNFSDLGLQVLLSYTPKIFARYDAQYNFYGLGFKKHSFSLGLNDVWLDNVQIEFQDDRAWNTKQLTLNLSHVFYKKLQTTFYLSRNLLKDENTEVKLGISYLHDCYLIGGSISVTPKDTKIFFRFELKGLGGYELGK